MREDPGTLFDGEREEIDRTATLLELGFSGSAEMLNAVTWKDICVAVRALRTPSRGWFIVKVEGLYVGGEYEHQPWAGLMVARQRLAWRTGSLHHAKRVANGLDGARVVRLEARR